eukprot:4773325-Pyramimonas_sp.AAC.1
MITTSLYVTPCCPGSIARRLRFAIRHVSGQSSVRAYGFGSWRVAIQHPERSQISKCFRRCLRNVQVRLQGALQPLSRLELHGVGAGINGERSLSDGAPRPIAISQGRFVSTYECRQANGFQSCCGIHKSGHG